MDLKALDTIAASNAGAPMTVRDANGKAVRDAAGNPVTITLLGVDSNEYQSRKREHVDRVLQSQLQSRRRQSTAISAESFEDDTLEDCIACTTGWHGIVFEDKELEFSAANVRMLYTKLPMLREQVEEFIADRVNFLPASAKR